VPRESHDAIAMSASGAAIHLMASRIAALSSGG
jgi:hypothetical protein